MLITQNREESKKSRRKNFKGSNSEDRAREDRQQEELVEALLDSGVTGLVMSSEFAKKQGFKLKKLERPMNVRNVDGSLNKEGPIENM